MTLDLDVAEQLTLIALVSLGVHMAGIDLLPANYIPVRLAQVDNACCLRIVRKLAALQPDVMIRNHEA